MSRCKQLHLDGNKRSNTLWLHWHACKLGMFEIDIQGPLHIPLQQHLTSSVKEHNQEDPTREVPMPASLCMASIALLPCHTNQNCRHITSHNVHKALGRQAWQQEWSSLREFSMRLWN